MNILNDNKISIGVIGLGYVGLPLAIAFGEKENVIAFDTNVDRINQLSEGVDINNEISKLEIDKAKFIKFVSKIDLLNSCNYYIITIPTPIDEFKKPDLSHIFDATKQLSTIIKSGDIIIYESTVYPGCTEEFCVPLLESGSGMKFNKDFFCGYSPERINPGDKEHSISKVKKITSGSTEDCARLVDNLYLKIIDAGTYKAESIKVAEAAKVIENIQRDLNIALINEFSIIFDKMGLDTESILKAAETKWNFQKFRPGLVGGHCIGVDPYYLLHKCESIGYKSEIISNARKMNEQMSCFISNKLMQTLTKNNIKISGSKILIMGLTFKENCNDIRNSQVFEIIKQLKKANLEVDVYDNLVLPESLPEKQDFNLISNLENDKYDGIILAVAHESFIKMGIENIRFLGKKNHIIYDLKYLFKKNKTDIRL